MLVFGPPIMPIPTTACDPTTVKIISVDKSFSTLPHRLARVEQGKSIIEGNQPTVN